jgi:hypothetical protein
MTDCKQLPRPLAHIVSHRDFREDIEMLRSTHRKFVADVVSARVGRLDLSAAAWSLAATALGLMTIGLILAAAGPCHAAETTGGSKTGGADAAPEVGSASRPDEAERRKIIDSLQWRQMQHDLMEWLSVQRVYTPSQLRRVKAELNAKVAKMSPQELIDFMQDMEAKVKILMSPEAEKARLWAEERLAVQVNLTPAQLKQMRPDVLNMTTAQLQERLLAWEDQRKQTIATQQAFDRGRRTEVKNIEAMEKEEEQEREEALNRAYEDMSYGSPYGGYYGGGRAVNNPTWFRGGGAYYPGYRW